MTYELRKVQDFLDTMEISEQVFVEDILGYDPENYVLIEHKEDDFEILMELKPYTSDQDFDQKTFILETKNQEVLYDLTPSALGSDNRRSIIYIVVKNHTDYSAMKSFGNYQFCGAISENSEPPAA